MKILERNSEIENFLSNLDIDIDILYYIDIEDIDEINPFNFIYDELLEKGAFDKEVIYYSRAIEYLSDNDPSLQESLGIASWLGFDTANLNSEILASLLYSQNIKDEFYELEDEINNFFEDLEDLDEAEE